MSERCYLSFDRHEDSEALKDALNASKYKSFIEEFDNEVFRKIIKYNDYSMFDKIGDRGSVASIEAIVEELRTVYWEMYQEKVREE